NQAMRCHIHVDRNPEPVNNNLANHDDNFVLSMEPGSRTAHRPEIQYQDKHKSPKVFYAIRFELNQVQMLLLKHSGENVHKPEFLQHLQLGQDLQDLFQIDLGVLKYLYSEHRNC